MRRRQARRQPASRWKVAFGQVMKHCKCIIQRLDKGLGFVVHNNIDVAKDMLVRNGEQEFRCI